MGANDEALYDAEEIERVAREAGPEMRAWRFEREFEEAELARARADRERRWQMERPLEWAAWMRLRPVLRPEDLAGYDFPEFLAEVRPLKATGLAPDQVLVDQKDEGRPLRPGNLRWSTQTARPQPEPVEAEYLTLKQVAAMVGFSYDYVFDAVQKQDLVAYWKGRQWRVKPADVHAWMDGGRKVAAPVPRPALQDKVSRYFPTKKG